MDDEKTGAGVLVTQLGDKLGEKLVEAEEKAMAEHEVSGKMSGSKLGQPTLDIILNLLATDRKVPDAYSAALFQRGRDVEARITKWFTGKTPDEVEPGEKFESSGLLKGTVALQVEQGYRGGTGFIDLVQYTDEGEFQYEIKSVKNSKYARIMGINAVTHKPLKGEPLAKPDYQHCLQHSYYALGARADGRTVLGSFIVYVAADDYRIATFMLNPEEFQRDIDEQIDGVRFYLEAGKLPEYIPVLAWQRNQQYQNYPEWAARTPEVNLEVLQNDYPEAYNKLISGEAAKHITDSPYL